MHHTSTYFAPLTPSTADLVERYANLDNEGYIENYQIINKELIEALMGAGEWLKEGLSEGEVMGEVWSRPNPCEECSERVGCSITCRRKHAFDKEVYGGLLCGTVAAAERHNKEGGEAKNKVHFKVRFVAEHEGISGLIFEHYEEHLGEAIEIRKSGEIWICGRPLNLRPWSHALYLMFLLHPEGITLSSIAGTHVKKFIRLYKNCSQSTIKVKRLKEQLADKEGLSHLLNNKLSELNRQLRDAGVEPQFRVSATSHRANNKPYYIPYVREKK